MAEKYNWADYMRRNQDVVYAPEWGSGEVDPVREFKPWVRKAVIGVMCLLGFLFVASSFKFAYSSMHAGDDAAAAPKSVNENPVSAPEPPETLSTTSENAAEEEPKEEAKESSLPEVEPSRGQDIFKALEVVSGAKVTKYGTAQNTAASWIIDVDELKLDVDNPFLIQRYVMALLFFSMDGHEWVLHDWLRPGVSECDWPKVGCDEDANVISISLVSANVGGKLPHELSEVSNLKKIDLRNNHITGTVPTEWGNLYNLAVLYLEGNDIHGSIPDELCALRATTLQFFTSDCADQPAQVNCYCCTNCLSDATSNTDDFDRAEQIKKKLAEISTKELLETENSFQYQAQNWIIHEDNAKLLVDSPYLEQRYVVALMYYALDGTNWPYKQWLSGERSECLFPGIECSDLGYITTISLVSVELHGEIPEEMAALSYLEELELSHNHLSGAIPEALGELSRLERLLLQKNDLEGEVPSSICALREQSLVELSTDCTGTSPEVTCSCCTNCLSNSSSTNEEVIATTTEEEQGTATEEQEQPAVEMSTKSNTTTVPENEETEKSSAPDSFVDESLVNLEIAKKEEVPETTTTNRSADIENSIKFIFADQEISQTREDALVWIIQTDPKQVGADYPNLVQRYILALVYFATKGEEWTDAYKWLTDADECQWGHVTCDGNEQVTDLDFSNNNLQGQIPHEMSFLEILQTLDMSNNTLTGSIPHEFGNFYFLEKLHLYENNFDSGLPEEICYLKSEHLKNIRIDCDLECTCCDECGPP